MVEQKNNNNPPEWLKSLIYIGGAILIGYLLAKLFEYLFSSTINETSSRKQTMPRVFISHSWDFDDDYRTLIKRFNHYGFEYYNHSIPVEKALDEETCCKIEIGIRNKMRGCSKVIVLAGGYANNFWIKKEVQIANEMCKEIIAIRPWGATTIPSYLKNDADKIIGFNTKCIIESIKY